VVCAGERLAPLWLNHGGITMTSTPVRDTGRDGGEECEVWGSSIARQDLAILVPPEP